MKYGETLQIVARSFFVGGYDRFDVSYDRSARDMIGLRGI